MAEQEEVMMISRPPKLRQPYMQHPYPWLVFCDEERQIFYDILEDRYHIRFVPEMQNKSISYCHQEWLVLTDTSFTPARECSILNILTMEKVKLPPLDLTVIKPHNCVLFSQPNMDDVGLILFYDGRDDNNKVTYCHLGIDSGFVQQKLHGIMDILLTATCFGGNKMYALILPHFNLLAAGLPSSNHYPLDFTQVIKGGTIKDLVILGSTERFYLVESCGQVLFISIQFLHNEVIDISIFRADFVIKEWVRLFDLGDRAIFLDSYNSFSSPASALGLKGNSIYFVCNRRRNLYVYDVEDESISMSLPCPVVDFHSSPRWMLIPNHNS